MNVGDFGKWKDKGYSEKIPTLDEVLALIPEGRRLFIEIKCGPEILPELENTFKRAKKKPEQTVIIGFGYETMKQAKAKFPQLRVYWLAGAEGKPKKYAPLDDLLEKAKAAKVDGLDLEKGFPIDEAFVKKVHEAGLKVYTRGPWTAPRPPKKRWPREWMASPQIARDGCGSSLPRRPERPENRSLEC